MKSADKTDKASTGRNLITLLCNSLSTGENPLTKILGSLLYTFYIYIFHLNFKSSKQKL